MPAELYDNKDAQEKLSDLVILDVSNNKIEELPESFLVDYWRQEVLVHDDVVASAVGGLIKIMDGAWEHYFPNVEHYKIVTRAMEFSKE